MKKHKCGFGRTNVFLDSITTVLKTLVFLFEPGKTFKNISISMGFVPMAELIKLIESGMINTKFLMTHRAPLNGIVKGYDVFGNKKDNCLKWIVTSYEK